MLWLHNSGLNLNPSSNLFEVYQAMVLLGSFNTQNVHAHIIRIAPSNILMEKNSEKQKIIFVLCESFEMFRLMLIISQKISCGTNFVEIYWMNLGLTSHLSLPVFLDWTTKLCKQGVDKCDKKYLIMTEPSDSF